MQRKPNRRQKRYERRELSHHWEDIRPPLKDSAQMTYEMIRPGVVFGVSPKERAEEAGLCKSSIDDMETMMKASP